ncbi:hypothetical protein LTR94_026774 [Friedmanniomyces endolithicus]|nr:hypothetical protein LTR94_026774 [Friedmanniomyces endolithicus]
MLEAPPRGEDASAGPVIVPRAMLKTVIAPRVEETLELLRDRLKHAGMGLEPGAGLVLTGGASQLNGVRELAVRVFDRPVRLGRPQRAPHLADAAAGPALPRQPPVRRAPISEIVMAPPVRGVLAEDGSQARVGAIAVAIVSPAPLGGQPRANLSSRCSSPSELPVEARTATVIVECKPLPDGGLTECVVVEENPPGKGFGQAALDMAKRGRLHTIRTTIGDKVRFTVHFRSEM